MEEYLVLLTTLFENEKIGSFLGTNNRRRECLLSDLSSLFESYSKNSMMKGWKTEKRAVIYYKMTKDSFPNSKLIKVDVFAKPAIMKIVYE